MIGLMGGTFNPIHYGHLIICESIREEFSLEKIIFIPANNPPHKKITDIISADDRYEMVKMAISNNPYFEISDLEMQRPVKSYTIDTLKILKGLLGTDKKFALILGADSLIDFNTWKNYQEIFNFAAVIVALRPGFNEDLLDRTITTLKAKGAEIYRSNIQPMNFDSTDIRRRVKNGLSIKYRVPPEVEDYIYKKGLYR